MNQLVQKLISYLNSSAIDYEVEISGIIIALPEKFGSLEIKNADNQEVVIGIVDGSWQVVSGSLGAENVSLADKLISYIQGIYSGKFLMIEEEQPGRPTKKKIVDNLERYLKKLPNRTKFKIHNNKRQTEEGGVFSDL